MRFSFIALASLLAVAMALPLGESIDKRVSNYTYALPL